ncbi:MAG TPA: potassium-transporting ATPase subunit KdpA [Candidatus Acidoferrum sp.]|nr:potassium-transporting ATPase subunit KdpA [Candidatus Acidoferrum sp.]
MTANGCFQILLFILAVFLVTKPLGIFLVHVFERQRTFLDPVLRPLERSLYRVCGVDETHEMKWSEYGVAMLLFSGVSMILLYGIERAQHWLPLNPEKLPGIAPTLAWNTAASFTTNTNWQAYTPETTMSYLTQMAGLAYHNFVSAAVGIALAVAFVRGIARRESETIGNFWVDLTRCLLWVLLPACLLVSMALVSQGVVQTLHSYAVAQVMEPWKVSVQTERGQTVTKTVAQQRIALGPVASQEAIKMFGTNGGGFFNANSAHPYENPTPFTNFLEMFLIFAIPSALTYLLGRMTGSQWHGWAVWAAMVCLFTAGAVTAYWAESRGNPLLQGVSQSASATQPGGNMEGKEVRFGIAGSALFATVTTDASCGAVNGWHDSFTPLGGMVPLVNILLGEVVFGGVGSGLYGMLVFVILAVFLAGLMVGRTPEYLGKKIEAYDVKMAALSILVFPVTVLILSAAASVSSFGVSSISNSGPHGLTQMLYAYTSAAGNNGSAFAGLNANTDWYNNSTGIATLLGRFFSAIPVLAIAGNLARKRPVPESAGTFPVTTPLFAALLVSTVIIVGALTFFPVLSLGPVLEHLMLYSGKVF